MFTEFGVIVALVHVTLPVMVIMLAAALAHIDRDYERAAQSLGAGPVRAFLTVTLPLSMPGVVAGFTTAFAWTFSAFATPQVIGGGKVSVVSTLSTSSASPPSISRSPPPSASPGSGWRSARCGPCAAPPVPSKRWEAIDAWARLVPAAAGLRRVVVGLILAFIVLPAVVVTIAAFNERAILSFPPTGYSTAGSPAPSPTGTSAPGSGTASS